MSNIFETIPTFLETERRISEEVLALRDSLVGRVVLALKNAGDASQIQIVAQNGDWKLLNATAIGDEIVDQFSKKGWGISVVNTSKSEQLINISPLKTSEN